MNWGSGDPEIFGVRRTTWLAALLFTLLTVFLAYPLSLHPSSLRFTTGPDGDLGWYLLGWNTHAFLHKPWAIFDANIYYPERLTLAYGENVIGIALFAAPVIWLGGHLLLAANVVCLLSSALCGLAAYILARRVGLSVAAAVICGIIFECSPPRFLRIGQMNLSSVQWIPFTLAALHAYFDGGRRRDLRIAAAFISLQVLSSGHGAVFLVVALLVFGAYRLMLGEPVRLLTRIRDLGVVGVLLLLPSVLVFLPYRAVQQEVGLKRGLGSWISNNQSFLASPSHVHRYLLDLFGRADVNATAAAYLFPGYLPLVLGAVALLWGTRSIVADRRTTWRVAAVLLEASTLVAVIIASVLTIGTVITVDAATRVLVAPGTAMQAWVVCSGLVVLGLALSRVFPTEFVSRHAWPLLLLSAAAIGWSGLTAVRPTIRAGDGLRSEYFSSADWNGAPAFSATDTVLTTDRIRHRWKGAPPERFAVRWMGFLTVRHSGVYHFATTSDDGSRLFIDRGLVVNNSGSHKAETRSGRVKLEPGSHLVELQYVQLGGAYDLSWAWSADGTSYDTVPDWLLSQRRTHYSIAVAARMVGWAIQVFAVLAVLTAVWYVQSVLSSVLKGRGAVLIRWRDARRRDATTFYAFLTLATLALAMGPPYGLWRYVYALPGFSFIRANTRFTLIALLGVAVLAGIGFDRITRLLSGRHRMILATATAVLLVVEFAAMPMAVQPSNFHIPAIDRWLNTQPKPFVIAEVPVHNLNDVSPFEWAEVNYMIHSTAHWQKTVHGYSGWRTDFHRQLYWEMHGFPDEKSLASLSDLGVTYIVVHTESYPSGEWAKVQERIEQFAARLRLEHVEGAGRVYSLVRPD